MHAIRGVGDRLESTADWPEGVTLTMFAGEPVQLMIMLNRPHELEVQAVTAAPTQFAWVDGEHAAVLAYRLGPVLPWSQVTYDPHLFAETGKRPDVDRDPTVRIMLVDRDTGTIQALQDVRWPEEFAATVRASVARMRARPHHSLDHDHVLAALQRRYPTAEDLVVDRADARCTAVPVAHDD